MNKTVNVLNGNYEPISYSKNYVEQVILEKDKEIEKLNKECDTYMKIATKKDNIINELEKFLNEEIEDYNKALNSKLLSESGKEKYEAEKVCFLDMLDKIKELKEKSDKE